MTFPEPPFMEDLHRLRVEHYEATKHLSPAEYVRQVNEAGRRTLEALGYELVPSPDGRGQIIVLRQAGARRG